MDASEFRTKLALLSSEQLVSIVCTDGESQYTALGISVEILGSSVQFRDVHCGANAPRVKLSYSVIADVVKSIPSTQPSLRGMTATGFAGLHHVVTGCLDDAAASMLYLVIRFIDGQQHITPDWSLDFQSNPTSVFYIPVHCEIRSQPICVSYDMIADLENYADQPRSSRPA